MGEPAEMIIRTEQDECRAEAEALLAQGYQVLRDGLALALSSPNRSTEFRRHFEGAQSTWRSLESLERLLGRVR